MRAKPMPFRSSFVADYGSSASPATMAGYANSMQMQSGSMQAKSMRFPSKLGDHGRRGHGGRHLCSRIRSATPTCSTEETTAGRAWKSQRSPCHHYGHASPHSPCVPQAKAVPPKSRPECVTRQVNRTDRATVHRLALTSIAQFMFTVGSQGAASRCTRQLTTLIWNKPTSNAPLADIKMTFGECRESLREVVTYGECVQHSRCLDSQRPQCTTAEVDPSQRDGLTNACKTIHPDSMTDPTRVCNIKKGHSHADMHYNRTSICTYTWHTKMAMLGAKFVVVPQGHVVQPPKGQLPPQGSTT